MESTHLELPEFNAKIWGEVNAEELATYQNWLATHPHCGSPRLPGIDGPKPNQIPDEKNPELYYIDYSKDRPKPHNLYAKDLGKLGRTKEVSDTFEFNERSRKELKKMQNKLLPWENPLVSEYMAEYHVEDSNIAGTVETYEPAISPRTTSKELKLAEKEQSDSWPAYSKILAKTTQRTKVSPYVPAYIGTEFTRNGQVLVEYNKSELFKAIDKYLRRYAKKQAEESLHKSSASEKAVATMNIHEAVSENISNQVALLTKDIGNKNYWYDKYRSVENEVSSLASLDLDEACFRGNVLQVKMLLAAGKSPSNPDDEPLFNRMFEKALMVDLQEDSLHIGSDESDVRKDIQKILHLLSSHGANVNTCSQSSRLAPIHRAAIGGNAKMVMWLLNHRADLYLKSKKDSMTATQYAARQGHVVVLAEIIRKVAGLRAVEDTDNRGRNSLHIASLFGQTAAALLLLHVNMNKRKEDGDGKTPGDLAYDAGFKHTANAVKGFSYPEHNVKHALQYITDQHNRHMEEDDQFQGVLREDDDDQLSVSSALLRMKTGTNSTMKHIMSYLFKSLNINSEKLT